MSFSAFIFSLFEIQFEVSDFLSSLLLYSGFGTISIFSNLDRNCDASIYLDRCFASISLIVIFKEMLDKNVNNSCDEFPI